VSSVEVIHGPVPRWCSLPRACAQKPALASSGLSVGVIAFISVGASIVAVIAFAVLLLGLAIHAYQKQKVAKLKVVVDAAETKSVEMNAVSSCSTYTPVSPIY